MLLIKLVRGVSSTSSSIFELQLGTHARLCSIQIPRSMPNTRSLLFISRARSYGQESRRAKPSAHAFVFFGPNTQRRRSAYDILRVICDGIDLFNWIPSVLRLESRNDYDGMKRGRGRISSSEAQTRLEQKVTLPCELCHFAHIASSITHSGLESALM